MHGAYFRQDVSASNMSQISVMSGNWLLNHIYCKEIHQIDDCSPFWIKIRDSRAKTCVLKVFRLKGTSHCLELH